MLEEFAVLAADLLRPVARTRMGLPISTRDDFGALSRNLGRFWKVLEHFELILYAFDRF